MALTLNIGRCTLLGNYRENNEDSVDVKAFPDMTVCLVADGMGGQAAGEVASKRAIEIVPRELKKYGSGAVGNEETKNILRRSIVQANEEIMAMAALDRELKNMGTTIVVTLWRKGSSLMYVTFIHACPISSTVRSPNPTHWSGSGLFGFARVLSYHAVTLIMVPLGNTGAASSA